MGSDIEEKTVYNSLVITRNFHPAVFVAFLCADNDHNAKIQYIVEW